MTEQDILPPETHVRANRLGTVVGILLVVWAVAFALLAADLTPVVYWTVGGGVCVLIIAVPSWLFGRRARREHLARQRSDAG